VDSPTSNASPAAGAQRDPWQEARSRGVEFRAVGQEPGWYVEIDHEGELRLLYDYGEQQLTARAPAPVFSGERTTYAANSGATRITVFAERRTCRDVMSGQEFPLDVRVTVGGRELRGCGRDLRTDPQAWRADPRGVGPVRVGMSDAELRALLGLPPAPAAAAGECVYVRAVRTHPAVMFMTIDGLVVRVDVVAPGIQTTEGLEVGSTESAVRAAFGTRITASPHKYTTGQYLTAVADGPYRIVFETDGERVARYRVGRVPEVEWVEGCS
jgi:uncharacterized membrane protein